MADPRERSGEKPTSIPALEGWLIQRRIEWAGQLLTMAAMKFPFPKEDVRTLLHWLLIESWHADGQHSFHKHASRDGSPPAGTTEDL